MRTRSLRAAGAIGAVATFGLLGAAPVHATTPNVLLVCPTGPNDGPGLAGPVLTCPAGQYASIQDAVNHAVAGDWILVAPGDYHEKADTTAGVHITTPNLHLRGMDRNGVVVDGTKSTATTQCSSATADQDTNSGHGRNGIEVFKVDGTSVDNLTTCNYLTGDQGGGNEIWWNGGDSSGLIGMGAYSGSYITGTTSYSDPTNNGSYGIFVSNSKGPGTISYAYASNMSDSGFYVGACPDCNATLNHVHSENNVLGYSGTNAGGHLDILNSEWDLNKSGIVPNSLNNDDAPPPQSGLCPGFTSLSCTYIVGNLVHDNNNPNTPGSGIAAAAPIGTGIELSGASWNTVDSNTVYNQKGWGIVTHDYPDTETPPSSGVSSCQGGVSAPGVCTFQAQGNVISNNTLHDNGGFGNPSNGDLANEFERVQSAQLLLRQHRRGRPDQRSADDPDGRRPTVHGAGRWRQHNPCRRAGVRLGRVRLLPRRHHRLSAVDRGPAPQAQRPGHHAQPVRRRPRQPLVHERPARRPSGVHPRGAAAAPAAGERGRGGAGEASVGRQATARRQPSLTDRTTS